MPVDVDLAVAFIRAHGTEFDRARVDLLLENGALLSSEQRQRFYAGQRDDGGWPAFWAPDYSSVDATCFRFAQSESMWMGFGWPVMKRAETFLRSRQGEDGSWEEDWAVRELAPPWAKPGELAPRLYLTANCGWWLANTALHGIFVSTDAAAQRAGTYLAQHVGEGGSLPSFLHTHWLAAGLWIRLGRADLAERVLEKLATRMTDDIPSSSLAWMLTTLAGLGVSADHPVIQRATTLLLSQQRADGSWASEDGPERDPYATVETLRGLIQWAAL
jgi:hypothetical protein